MNKYIITKLEKINNLTQNNYTIKTLDHYISLHLDNHVIFVANNKKTFETKLDCFISGLESKI